jgi:hypothetical protein
MSRNQIFSSQTGSSRLKAILWTGILAAFIYVCVQVLPIFMADFQFRDTMQTAARFASIGRHSPEDIRADLFKEAQKADMPIRLEDIKVDTHNGTINIEANYSVTVDLHVYQWTLNFHPSVSNSRL